MKNKRLGACILAAGYSSRMGKFKPKLQLGDKTVLEHVIHTAKEAGISDIIVITGYNRDLLEPYIRREQVTELYNPNYPDGMFTSIQAGAEAFSPEIDGFFLMPVDCPLTGSEILCQMAKAFEPGQDLFYVPTYKGKKGHPLLIPQYYWQKIMDHDGRGGLKRITDKVPDKMVRIPTDHEGVIMDMDDREAYKEIKSYLARGFQSESLIEAAKGRRFFLVRHGQIKQHAEKIFLGITDVPLSDLGMQQAVEAGRELSQYEIDTPRIYSSNLQRAMETAQEIEKIIGPKEIVPTKGFREMCLGYLEGKYIRDIQERMPDDYERRGRDLFTYKKGSHAENFYDLQYRVEKALLRLLRQDEHTDIIIVAHRGVFRAICNNLEGKGIEEPWDQIPTGKVRVIQM